MTDPISVQHTRRKTAVIILNWNAVALTVRCLESVRKSDYGWIEMIVVDNGSTDGSPAVIAAQYPDAVLVRNDSNVGFAQGANQGIEHALQDGADYVLLLNNDTIVEASMISHLVATAVLYRNSVAVSPEMLNGYEPRRLWFVYGKTNLWTGIFSNPAHNGPAGKVFDLVVPMQYASGCCILIPKEMIRAVGELESSYFAYCEDVEWSIRARRAGFGLVCNTRAKLWHYIGSTGGKNPSRMRYLMTRNHIWTLRRHASARQFALFALVFYPPRCIFRLLGAVRKRNWACIPAEFRGAHDGFFAPRSATALPTKTRP